jgi:hypothetical protein
MVCRLDYWSFDHLSYHHTRSKVEQWQCNHNPLCASPGCFKRLVQQTSWYLDAIRGTGWVGGGAAIWRQGKEEVGAEALLRDKHNYYGQGNPWRVQVGIAPTSNSVSVTADWQPACSSTLTVVSYVTLSLGSRTAGAGVYGNTFRSLVWS